ncbi:MAG: hypothetical protein IJH40_06115 [Ruminococcus sp.]|uniref:hypothetical protein n=1 Tax=Ruminococcus sp. TaxID=41978 RepID=UPI0028736202|nr:hypothetical protein [Ruminococcus sp.]MBQ3285200.1 hypothetical protein [Ruminococcus sp.]
MKSQNLTNRIKLKSLSILPYGLLVRVYNSSKRNKDALNSSVEDLIIKRFFKDSPIVKDFNATIDRAKKNNKWCVIEQTVFSYSYVNVCLISEVISLTLWCLENGYMPLYDIKNKDNTEENLWERMFRQPFDADLNDVKRSGNYIICPFNTYVWPDMQDARNPQRVMFWNKMFKMFVVYNDDCQKYLDDEYETIIKGKRVLGTLIRGVEYEKAALKNHPKQPSVDEFISKAKEVLLKDELDYVYLATEDETIANKVKKAFGDKVLVNKRQYYDKHYRDDDFRKKPITYDREDGAFLKALEYMSSINLVSKCDSFVGGLCGGSEAAEFFNGNQYKTNYIFDRGVF